MYLEYENLDVILAKCPSVKSITANLDTLVRSILHKGRSKHLRFEGVTPLYQETHNWYVQSGRFLKQGDLNRNESVCVIGAQVQINLFGQTNPIGLELKIGTQRFTVIGVMEEKGNRVATEGWDERLIIPFTTMEKRFIGNSKWGFEFWIQAKSFEKID